MADLVKTRVDKWLWAVRIFKTRTLATEQVKSGKVRLAEGGDALKPSYLLSRGQTLTIKKEGFTLTIKVLDLLDKRVAAMLAQACYEDQTPEAERNKYKAWYLEQSVGVVRERGTGRPTKKQRRDIDYLSGGDKIQIPWWEALEGGVTTEDEEE